MAVEYRKIHRSQQFNINEMLKSEKDNTAVSSFVAWVLHMAALLKIRVDKNTEIFNIVYLVNVLLTK